MINPQALFTVGINSWFLMKNWNKALTIQRQMLPGRFPFRQIAEKDIH
jgi:hypothetical protein